MTNAPDSFDWSSVGDEPLPGEMDDDALLDAVLADADVAPVLVPTAAAPRWIRPAVVAAVLLAAAIVLIIVVPSWSEALLGSDDAGSLAPDVEAPEEGDDAIRKHAESTASTPPRVLKGAPVVPEPFEEPLLEASSDVATPQDAPRRNAPPAPPPSADALLRTAQDALAAKDTAGAIRKYSALVRHHPKSAQARTARVSLGRLQLSAGRPKKSLAQFDRYLEGAGGGLRREAELGRIDALHKLGRTDAEKRAIEAFLKAHPNAVHAGRLRKQLETLP